MTHKTKREFIINPYSPTIKEVEIASQMCELAAIGDIEGLKALQKKGQDLSSVDYDQRSCLHLAAASGQLETVKYLCEQKVKRTFDHFGGLAIHDAMRNNHTDIVDFLKSQPLLQVVDKIQGYEFNEQAQVVFHRIIQEGFFSCSFIADEVDYFFNKLGIDIFYFKKFSDEQIAKHIHSFIAAKKVAEISRQTENIVISIDSPNETFHLCTTQNLKQTEKRIDEYIRKIPIQNSFTSIYMKSKAPALQGGHDSLEIYVIKINQYKNPILNSTNVYEICSEEFLNKRDESVIKRYQKIITLAYESPVPIMVSTRCEDNTSIIMFGVQQGNVQQDHTKGKVEEAYHVSFYPSLSRLFESFKINFHKQIVESFANGVVVYTFYIKQIPSQVQIEKMQDLSNLIFSMPQSLLIEMYVTQKITVREMLYFYSASVFTYYFMHQNLEDYKNLCKFFEGDQANIFNLQNLKSQLITEPIKMLRLQQIVQESYEAIKPLYVDFSMRLTGKRAGYNYLDIGDIIKSQKDLINKEVISTFWAFNKSVLKTNFYSQNKSAIAFRLDPQIFLQKQKWEDIPFGIFMLIGSDFNGFHVRFRDIARGGIRLIKATNLFEHNFITQFKENYDLARTQMLKNKDILESGSKGTILMLKQRNHMASIVFHQYIDSMLDLMLVKAGSGVIDLYNKQELVFFGPDENTADLMDNGCLFAKAKNYQYWKSITTGKSSSLGGIPHDIYGMTTRSVRQYVTGIQRYLNLKEEECTKFMTGGPDGDLGSNEIKMSKEKIVGIADGSGVLCDMEGIDRVALLKLATDRQMVRKFLDPKYNGKLSKIGYFVDLNDKNKKLPNGVIVPDGEKFRNEFHLNQEMTADFFVPCGGRPEAVKSDNVDKMFFKDNKNKCRFKYIVEGANLFFAENCRQILEEKGVILFKDASANKGGVTSSSYEVMAAMCLNDQEFEANMTIKPEHVHDEEKYPPFYLNYVKEIQTTIERNARNEFEYIWKINKETKKLSCNITNELSEGMNKLSDTLLSSNMFSNTVLRKKVLHEAIPGCLVNLVGMDEILKRLPENYQRSLFAKYLAGQYFYTYGSQSNVYLFYEFMKQKFDSA